MISEAMKRAGWRSMPDEATRKAWQQRNGRWLVSAKGINTLLPPGIIGMGQALSPCDGDAAGAWLPVNGATWHYDPDGWTPPIEDHGPATPGLYWVWRRDGWEVVDWTGPDGEAYLIGTDCVENVRDLQGLWGPACTPPSGDLEQWKGAELTPDVFNRAARDLPEGWRIEVCLEKDAGWVILTDAEGEEYDTCNTHPSMEARIDACVAQARELSGES